MSASSSLTILFADVSGSTKLFETRGNIEARGIIAAVLDALHEVARRHGGRLVKTIGDEIMCTFPGAIQGLLASTDMQRRIKSDLAFVQDNIGIRVGLHHGEALVEESDIFGDAVNVAARMAALAKRDQIVATASTALNITNAAGVRVRSVGTARVAGKLLPIEIVDVMWQEDVSHVTTVQRIVQFSQNQRVVLTLRHLDREFQIDELSDPFTLGREEGHSLTIESDWVSRDHAMIEWKKGHFILSDRSTNGTWVKIGTEELLVHRDAFHLRRSGTISLGQAHAAENSQLLHFECGSV
ncbi:MAG: adenylate/guanylate cyclase domain-containing protein [Dokdonella sp.]|uniref:adenylate/guanylate cyclase domain-containing protein n=1 Tax=Dokdonella sp. TaxID=2291710 RepID=UPI002CD0E8D5|nr:adenylate/guanylate cyclase domain-containing protein [Dokdonella sp.]HOX71551.1 adenylate/guanylate cyclase domain-containing protein [Dokdonella sp.]HPG95359.1 adenylate/guanylate cyclase domain-containing protein [Dokdonella sp.]HPN80794.1 adenylate/guanylate cyclase domain-containing protein [Dokdonella sp.]